MDGWPLGGGLGDAKGPVFVLDVCARHRAFQIVP
jgi:hypothetical protein